MATQLLAKSKRAEGTSPNIIGEGYVKVVYLLTCYSKELKFCEMEEEMDGQLRLFPEESSNQ